MRPKIRNLRGSTVRVAPGKGSTVDDLLSALGREPQNDGRKTSLVVFGQATRELDRDRIETELQEVAK